MTAAPTSDPMVARIGVNQKKMPRRAAMITTTASMPSGSVKKNVESSAASANTPGSDMKNWTNA